jgi:hypothetical protein
MNRRKENNEPEEITAKKSKRAESLESLGQCYLVK